MYILRTFIYLLRPLHASWTAALLTWGLRPHIKINLQVWAKSGRQLFTYHQLTVYCIYFFQPLYSPHTSKPHPCLGLRPRSPAMLMWPIPFAPQIDVYLRYLYFRHNIFIKRRNWIAPSMMVWDKVLYWTSIMILPRRVRTSVSVRCTSVELLELWIPGQWLTNKGLTRIFEEVPRLDVRRDSLTLRVIDP